MENGILLAIVLESLGQRSNESKPSTSCLSLDRRTKIETYGSRYCVDTLTQTPSQKLSKRGDGEIKEARRDGKGSRVKAKKSGTACRFVVERADRSFALSDAHKFPNRWKMHFSRRAPGRLPPSPLPARTGRFLRRLKDLPSCSSFHLDVRVFVERCRVSNLSARRLARRRCTGLFFGGLTSRCEDPLKQLRATAPSGGVLLCDDKLVRV